jgi:SAM-dependent methyltransferase
MLEKSTKEMIQRTALANVFEPIWNDPQFVIQNLKTLRLGAKFIMGDLGYRGYLLEYIGELINMHSTIDPLNILDLGSGNMRFGRAIAANYANSNKYNYIGIDQMDLSKDLGVLNTSYIQYDIKKFEKIIHPQSQDLVLCAGLIHYLPKISTIYEVLRQSYKVLKTGGLMIFNLPHPDLYDLEGVNNKIHPTWMHVKPRIEGYLYEMQHFDSLGNSFTANILKLDLNKLDQYLRFLGFNILKIEVRKNPLAAFVKNQHLQQLKPEELEELANQNTHILYFIQKP